MHTARGGTDSGARASKAFVAGVVRRPGVGRWLETTRAIVKSYAARCSMRLKLRVIERKLHDTGPKKSYPSQRDVAEVGYTAFSRNRLHFEAQITLECRLSSAACACRKCISRPPARFVKFHTQLP